jgi:prepilin-type N-terminal cleavage/methylation domain-containing protein
MASHRDSARARRGARRGFTLLELLLALGLAVVLMSLVGFSLSATMRATNAGRDDVHHAQIARAILRRIASDVRGAVWYKPVDMSSMLPAAAATGGGGAGGAGAGGAGAGATGGAGGAAGGAGAAAGSGESEGTDALSSQVTTDETAPPLPGLHGGANWVEADVSRLPAPEGYAFMGGAGALPDVDSEIKTVAYWVDGGLCRREMDWAVTQFANSNGAMADLQSQIEPLAVEVLDLQFRYFDGSQWLTEWSSTDLGGVPVAIEISIALADPRVAGETIWHTLLVDLPMGGGASASTETTTDATSDANTSAQETP